MHRVAVCVSQKTHAAVPLPQDVREKIQQFMVG
jgi:acyl-CoA thioesterase FadM